MQKKPLVSIITPCHNSEAFLNRLLDSILSQTYPCVEMFAVDNDSTDKTADIIKSYIPKFQNRGYKLTYIHQDDLGPSSAIQTGLRVISGEYLLMPDSDDYYNTVYALEKWVDVFQSLSSDYAIVRCRLQFVNEDGLVATTVTKETGDENLFEDCLFGINNYCFAPINYMVKVSTLKELTGMEIFNAYNFGQQRQICVPLYYEYKAYTILEPLACYLVRKKSVSHGDYAKYPIQKTLYARKEEYIDSIFKCLRSMPATLRQKLRNEFLRQEVKNITIRAINTQAFDDLSQYCDDYQKYQGQLLSLKLFIFQYRLKQLIKSVLNRQ